MPMCWKDRAYRAARRNRQAVARLSPVTERTAALWSRGR